jgi:hypothetical protein
MVRKSKEGSSMFTKVSAKLGSMRKPQDFLIQPTDDGRVLVQSTKSIGWFEPKTGKGRLCTTGCYSWHLSTAKPFRFPPEFISEALHACPSLGGETIHHTVTIKNTVKII